jgi:uncharacterized protein (DUF2126 family)
MCAKLRSTRVQGLFEVWGVGDDMEDVRASLRACPKAIMDPWLGPSTSFKFIVDGFGRKLAQPEQLETMEAIEPECFFEVPQTHPV